MIYSIILGHHFIVTIVILFMEEFKFKIFYLNFFLTLVGITIILFIKSWKFGNILIEFSFFIHYFLSNIFNLLLVNFFAVFHSKKYINTRITLIAMCIYVLGTITPITIFIIVLSFIIIAIK